MPLLSMLLWVLSTPLPVWFGLLLSLLRWRMLRRPRLLLRALLLVAISRPLGRPRHLLGMLPLVLFSPLGPPRLRLPLPLLLLSLLLSMMRVRTGRFMLALLFGTVPVFALPLLLWISRSGNCEKASQDRATGKSNCFHRCHLPFCAGPPFSAGFRSWC
jgi:hypothetical protein